MDLAPDLQLLTLNYSTTKKLKEHKINSLFQSVSIKNLLVLSDVVRAKSNQEELNLPTLGIAYENFLNELAAIKPMFILQTDGVPFSFIPVMNSPLIKIN